MPGSRAVLAKPAAAGGPTILASDSFTGGDDSDIDGRNTDSALGGSAKTWAKQGAGATFGITSGELVKGGTTSTITYAFDAGDGDIYAHVVAQTVSTSAVSLLVRQAATLSTITHYSARIATAGVLQLNKIVTGTVTQLGTDQTWTAGDVVGVRCVGDQISLMKNGSAIITVTDAAIANTNTKVGLRGGTVTAVRLDDLVVEDA